MVMEVKRRALYNLLQMNWCQDKKMDVQPWQVENYRCLASGELFAKLHELGIHMDKDNFTSFAEAYDTPEELADGLASDDGDASLQDRIYLVVFELWRQLFPERRALTVFCDELDHQISHYDNHEAENFEGVQDILAVLQKTLEETADSGEDAKELFCVITEHCANDIETFLFDFIAGQLDESNDDYAFELIEEFYLYVQNVKWFDFLRARLVANSDIDRANKMLRSLIEKSVCKPDIEFNFEMLFFLAHCGDKSLFIQLVKQTFSQITVEEELLELMNDCVDFFESVDMEKEAYKVDKILASRQKMPLDNSVNLADPDVAYFLTIIEAL
ncbi:hypothetical protein JYU14_02775 [Simkania negevensis]|uniref:Uncharacterized protein n=1 Tax=Simkania negevensis TaxID=83561 RepID=A0ABS3AQI5_9BACT|nr:hypothetical protein [Simkania negevensis]